MGEFRQEMPPPNGYAPIVYKRIPLKAGMDPRLKLLIGVSIVGVGFAYFRQVRWEITMRRLEDWSANSALTPLVVAETDRILLKQMKRNRDAEERIMKDVKGWDVGKWQHLPVYSSFGPDEYFRPSIFEYFMHGDEKEMMKYRNLFIYN